MSLVRRAEAGILPVQQALPGEQDAEIREEDHVGQAVERGKVPPRGGRDPEGQDPDPGGVDRGHQEFHDKPSDDVIIAYFSISELGFVHVPLEQVLLDHAVRDVSV